MSLPAMEALHATVVIVGGHEGGAGVPVKPLAEYGPLLRAESAGEHLAATVDQALGSPSQPVCVVPMTMGRDPGLVAAAARTLLPLATGAAAGRIMLADAFGDTTLLTGWLRVAVNRAAGPAGVDDLAVLLTANTANSFDNAELFRIAHLVKVQNDIPWIEVAFRGGDPDLAEGVERCEQLGAGRIAVIPADFGPTAETPPLAGVINSGPLLSPSTVSGMIATRVAGALLKLSRGDDGIASGLDADHYHGHGGPP